MCNYCGMPANYVDIGFAVAKILFAMTAASIWAFSYGYKRGKRAAARLAEAKRRKEAVAEAPARPDGSPGDVPEYLGNMKP
jgi:hypothetical protein